MGWAVLFYGCVRIAYDSRAPAAEPTASTLDAGRMPVVLRPSGDDNDAGFDDHPTDVDAGGPRAVDAGPANGGTMDAAIADAATADAATPDAGPPPNPLLGVFYGNVTNDPAGPYQMCAEIHQLDQPGTVAGTSRGTDTAAGVCSGLWRVSDLVLNSSTGGRYRFAETVTYAKSSCAQQGNGVTYLTSTGADTIVWEWAATSASANQASATLQRRSSCP